MSSSLHRRPVPKDLPPAGDLSDHLKHCLAQRYWGHGGSLTSEPIILDRTDLAYLEGLADGGVEDASMLIEGINDHDRVQIWIEN